MGPNAINSDITLASFSDFKRCWWPIIPVALLFLEFWVFMRGYGACLLPIYQVLHWMTNFFAIWQQELKATCVWNSELQWFSPNVQYLSLGNVCALMLLCIKLTSTSPAFNVSLLWKLPQMAETASAAAFLGVCPKPIMTCNIYHHNTHHDIA